MHATTDKINKYQVIHVLRNDELWAYALSVFLLCAHWSGTMLIQLGSYVSAHAYNDCLDPGSHMVTDTWTKKL